LSQGWRPRRGRTVSDASRNISPEWTSSSSMNSAIRASLNRAGSCSFTSSAGYMNEPRSSYDQSRLWRMAKCLWRCENDQRLARSPHPPLRHRRDRQRELALQEPALTGSQSNREPTRARPHRVFGRLASRPTPLRRLPHSIISRVEEGRGDALQRAAAARPMSSGGPPGHRPRNPSPSSQPNENLRPSNKIRQRRLRRHAVKA
jgi:hypothetical protein